MTHYIFRKYLHVDRNASKMRLGMENVHPTFEIRHGKWEVNEWNWWWFNKKQLMDFAIVTETNFTMGKVGCWKISSEISEILIQFISFAEVTAFCSMTESCIQHPNEKNTMGHGVCNWFASGLKSITRIHSLPVWRGYRDTQIINHIVPHLTRKLTPWPI